MKNDHDLVSLLNDAEFPHFLKTYPEFVSEIQALQKEILSVFTESSKQIGAQLNQMEKSQSLQKSSTALSIQHLRMTSAAHQYAYKAQADSAKQLLLSMMANSSHSGWNPIDPSTYQPIEKSELIALVNFGLNNPAP